MKFLANELPIPAIDGPTRSRPDVFIILRRGQHQEGRKFNRCLFSGNLHLQWQFHERTPMAFGPPAGLTERAAAKVKDVTASASHSYLFKIAPLGFGGSKYRGHVRRTNNRLSLPALQKPCHKMERLGISRVGTRAWAGDRG